MKWDIIPQKFIADAMLGKFAKKLRFLGVDIYFYPDIRDDELIKIVLSENRILISSDRELCSRKTIKKRAFYIKNDKTEKMVELFLNEFSKYIKIKPFSRCSKCNSELLNVEKEKVKSVVPPYIYKTHKNFKYCPVCKKVYWKGTHIKNMEKYLKNFLPDQPTINPDP